MTCSKPRALSPARWAAAASSLVRWHLRPPARSIGQPCLSRTPSLHPARPGVSAAKFRASSCRVRPARSSRSTTSAPVARPCWPAPISTPSSNSAPPRPPTPPPPPPPPGPPSGYEPLRRHLIDEARRQSLAAPGDDLLITNGCQQALDLIARVLLRPDRK